MMFTARIGPLFFVNGDPWDTVSYQDDYDGRDNQMSVVRYKDVECQKDMGRKKKKRDRRRRVVPKR